MMETCPHYLTRTAYDPDLDARRRSRRRFATSEISRASGGEC